MDFSESILCLVQTQLYKYSICTLNAQRPDTDSDMDTDSLSGDSTDTEGDEHA